MNVKDFNDYVKENYGDKHFYHGSPYAFSRFDMDKVGTGDGLSKYGVGLYFADTIEAAKHYAEDLTIGNLRENGYNLYTVRLTRLADYVDWENDVEHDVLHRVCDKLEEEGFEEGADDIRNEYRSYGDYLMSSLYDVVSSTVGGGKEATRIMYESGIAGVIADHMFLDCKVYVAYSDNNVKIISSDQLDFKK